MIRAQHRLFDGCSNPIAHGPKVCWVQTVSGGGRHGRRRVDTAAAVDSFGARTIRAEMPYNYDIVTIDKILRYDFACLSITSVVEMMNVLCDVDTLGFKPGQCKVVVGGMGALNIWPIHHLVDIAVFGRAEGQIADVLNGGNPPNVWRKAIDPDLEGAYEIRQASRLLPGEAGVGCPEGCAYCQYTVVRDHYASISGYRAGDVTGRGNVYEDDWRRLVFRSGRNQTAWDGWSEATRYRVRKRLSDREVVRKLVDLREQRNPTASNIKIYQIVGYPWETPETLHTDMTAVSQMLAEADGPAGTRIVLMFSVNIFSPEPLTPMAGERVDFRGWRSVINAWQSPTGRERQVHSGPCIEAFVLPQIDGPLTLQRRVAMNRADRRNAAKVREFVLRAQEPLDTEEFYAALDAEYRGQCGHLIVPKKLSKIAKNP